MYQNWTCAEVYVDSTIISGLFLNVKTTQENQGEGTPRNRCLYKTEVLTVEEISGNIDRCRRLEAQGHIKMNKRELNG